MTEVGSYEAKTHLPSLLERVANGEKITITKHGVPVARLVPVTDRPDPKEAVRALRAFRQGRNTAGLSVREMIEEGRR